MPDLCMQPICFPFTSLPLRLSSPRFRYALLLPQNKQYLPDYHFGVRVSSSEGLSSLFLATKYTTKDLKMSKCFPNTV